MKKLIFGFLLLALVACSSGASEGAVQTAIAQTAAAQPTLAETPVPTEIPTATVTIDPFEITKQANQTQNAAFQGTMDANATNVALTPSKTVTPTKLPSATPTPDLGSRNFPYSVGDVVNLTQSQIIEFTLQIVEVIRGEPAWIMIEDANSFNELPATGLEYVILRIKVVYNGADQGPLELSGSDWSTISKGRVYGYLDAAFDACCLEPKFDITLFAGGEAEGLLPLVVSIDDPSPLAAIGMDSDGTGGIFFSLVVP